MKNKKAIVIAIAAVVMMAGALYLITSPGEDGQRQGPGEHQEKMSRGRKILNKFGFGISTEQALSDYKMLAVYPPNSRPLTKDNEDLLHPNQRYERPQPIEEGSDIYYLLSADKYRVVGNEPITFILAATEGSEAKAEHVPLVIEKAVLKMGANPKSAKFVADLAFQKGDGQDYYCDYSMTASHPGPEYKGRFYAAVTFKVRGESVNAEIPFEYFPERMVPAAFTGAFNEELRDGSLTIRAEIDVKRKGWYIIDANLLDAAGEPVAYAIAKQELSPGRQQVPLLFFGKVLRDSPSSPPYVLKNLRGYRFVEVTTPDPESMDREMIREYEKEYRTRNYTKTQFSDKEYDSDDKRRRLQFLEKENLEAR